jgi:hypothetical protein
MVRMLEAILTIWRDPIPFLAVRQAIAHQIVTLSEGQTPDGSLKRH